MKTNSFWILVMTVALATSQSIGCGDNSLSNRPQEEWFLFFTPEITKEGKTDFVEQFEILLGTTATPGSIIHVISSPKHTPIAKLVVPEGSKKYRLRESVVREELVKVKNMIEGGGDNGGGQLEVPRVAATVRSLRCTDFRVKIVLMGSPIYKSELHKAMEMEGGFVPNDGEITIRKDGVFSGGKNEFPVDSEISWWWPDASWGASDLHRRAVTRIWRLYISERGGSMIRMTSSCEAAFNDSGMQFTGHVKPENNQLGVRHVGRGSVLAGGSSSRPEIIEITNPEGETLPPVTVNAVTMAFVYDATGSTLRRSRYKPNPDLEDSDLIHNVGFIAFRHDPTVSKQIVERPITRLYARHEDGGKAEDDLRTFFDRLNIRPGKANIQEGITAGMAMLDEVKDGTPKYLVVIGDASCGELPTDKPGDDERLLEQVRQWANRPNEKVIVWACFVGEEDDKNRDFFEQLGQVNEQSQFIDGSEYFDGEISLEFSGKSVTYNGNSVISSPNRN